MGMTVAEVLTAAAAKARTQRNADKAVAIAWGACHAERSLINPVFDAWCAAEGYRYHASQLGGILRRRYKTADEIADSLERAAAQATA